MATFRKMDAFTKTRPELRSQNAIGGLITVVALTVSTFLFLGEVFLYIRGSSNDNLLLSSSVSMPMMSLEESQQKFSTQMLSRAATVALHVLVTFPHLGCHQLDVIHDGASLVTGELKKIHPKHAIRLRVPYAHELKMGEDPAKLNSGCSVEGHMRVPIVAGKLQITLNRRTWTEGASLINRFLMTQVAGHRDKSGLNKQLGNRYNATHYVHYVRFDETFASPLSGEKPLENRPHKFENQYGGIAVQECKVELVPTYVASWMPMSAVSSRRMYQMSVVDSEILPEHMVDSGVNAHPGLVVDYDFSPLTVFHTAGRDNILVFLGSILSIAGGVFVTVSLVSGCLVHSAKVVAKKVD